MTREEAAAAWACKTNTFEQWVALCQSPHYRYCDQSPDVQSVANQLLCVLGSGYGWADGFVVNRCYEPGAYVEDPSAPRVKSQAEALWDDLIARGVLNEPPPPEPKAFAYYPIYDRVPIWMIAHDPTAHPSYVAAAARVCEHILSAPGQEKRNVAFAERFVGGRFPVKPQGGAS